MQKYILFGCFLTPNLACSSLKKDNEPKDPPSKAEEVSIQLAAYRPLVASGLDAHGLAVMGGSIGDSAFFSCLARVGGAATFDPMILFVDGAPRRHPELTPEMSKTPWSKDMMNGLLWCAWDVGRKGDKAKTLEITQALIDFGRAHQDDLAGWYFCTEEDRAAFKISDEDWLGRCLSPPAVVKDIYRVHKWAGGVCDDTCRFYMDIGANIPSDGEGFTRHLSVLTTLRNGLVEGALNDNSLDQLRRAAEAQPRNGLYLAAYHLFGDGDQGAAYAALVDASLFPVGELPTAANYCTEYLFQRDADQKDWLPCGESEPEGRGIDYILAATVALGELTQ